MKTHSATRKAASMATFVALAVVAAAADAQVPGGCNTPVSQLTSDAGCYLSATAVLGALPEGPWFWHLVVYPTRAQAQAARGPRGTVVGPLPTRAGRPYSARYMEAVFTPGMKAAIHRHSGPEAWYLVSGSQCLETPDGITVARSGEGAVVREGPPMALSSVGTEVRRSVLLVLHDTSQPWIAMESEWKPKGLCPT